MPARWRKTRNDDYLAVQDRELFAAIRDGREPNASAGQLLRHRISHQLEQQLAKSA